MMERIFVRNYALFLLALVLCMGSLIYTLIIGNIAMGHTTRLVAHTHDVILTAERISALVEGTLASQRGYIITGQARFLEDYQIQKEDLSDTIAKVSELTVDNPSQVSRLDEMRDYYTQFTTKLEERAAKYRRMQKPSTNFIDEIEIINGIKESMMYLNTSMLEEEYHILNQRVMAMDIQKSRYFNLLLVGVLISGALLLLFNGVLLSSQRKRNRAEALLRDTEKRFNLAVEGTQDGIFDWDLVTGQVFYSSRFFSMLGYPRDSFVGTTEDLKELIHPEDSPKIWKAMEDYMVGKLLEYDQEFRLKAADGRWIWIQSRARSIPGSDGKPVRIVGAHTDISLLRERHEKLEIEKKAAEDANRAKSDFLAHMSHEIRTPLTAISGIAEIFEKKQDNLDAKQKKLVRTLHSSTAALKDLINDILDFSKIESGELDLAPEYFNLAGLFETLISMMSLRANEKGISFVFNYKDVEGCAFYADKARVRQILINLIGNAIKFTDEGGVSVSAYPETRNEEIYLRIDVVDTGIGIEPEHFDLVFERFKQADPGVSRKYGGTGLGLPISKNLAQLMGGRIILSSQTGKGSTFTLLLPDRESALKKAVREKPADSQNLNERIRSTLEKDSKVLMVEDYEGNITVMGYILDDIGCTHDVARNGKEALDMWRANVYDLILMDVQMPVMDGFAATAAIRQAEDDQNLPRTPIIGMTAHAFIDDQDKCIAAGMDTYLPKPIVEEDLKQEILKYMNARRKAA